MSKALRMVFIGANRHPCIFPEECMVPTVQDGQMLIQITLATICGSDLHTVLGKRQEAVPSVLGHEAVGVVVENKRSGSDISPGDRVTFSVTNSCGTCRCCTVGLTQKCYSVTKYGHLQLSHGSGFNGCYATHIVLDKGTAVFKIPPDLSDHMAVPINCALATMVNAVSQIPLSAAYKTVLIQGAGLLGLYGCALLHDRGMKVYCVDTNPNRLSKVPLFGGHAVHPDMGHADMNADMPRQQQMDIVIEACGNASVIHEGLCYLRPGGMYILVGLVHPESHLNITAEQIIRKCLAMKGVHNYNAQHLKDAIDFMSRTHRRYPYNQLVTQTYPLRDLSVALTDAHTQNHLRVAVKP